MDLRIGDFKTVNFTIDGKVPDIMFIGELGHAFAVGEAKKTLGSIRLAEL
jgi:hypothetical protein